MLTTIRQKQRGENIFAKSKRPVFSFKGLPNAKYEGFGTANPNDIEQKHIPYYFCEQKHMSMFIRSIHLKRNRPQIQYIL